MIKVTDHQNLEVIILRAIEIFPRGEPVMLLGTDKLSSGAFCWGVPSTVDK